MRQCLRYDPVEALVNWEVTDDMLNEWRWKSFDFWVSMRRILIDMILDLYKQTYYEIRGTIHAYDFENVAIVISKLIFDPDLRKTIFDLRDKSLEQLLSSLDLVTVSFQCLDATLLTNFIYRLIQTLTLMFLPSCEVTCWRMRLNRRLNPAPSGALRQERVM